MTAKKHPQFILAMKAAFFDTVPQHFIGPMNRILYRDFITWPETTSALVVAERDALERDPTFRQVLPYVLMTQKHADGRLRFFAYQRTKGVGEQRLAGNVSVGIGGHIDAPDLVWSGRTVLVLHETLMDAARREVTEEVSIPDLKYILPDLHPTNWFITLPEDVHAVHLGVVMQLPLPDWMTDADIQSKESALLKVGLRSAQELLTAHASGEIQLEEWSLRLMQQQRAGETDGTSQLVTLE